MILRIRLGGLVSSMMIIMSLGRVKARARGWMKALVGLKWLSVSLCCLLSRMRFIFDKLNYEIFF
jgi:hypothetical protein